MTTPPGAPLAAPITPPVIAVIHATAASLNPVSAAFDSTDPAVNVWNILDDRLDRDAAAAGGLTPALIQRMNFLIQYAVNAGADAVQLACSMYAPVATAATQPVPVVASDQGMFDEVARHHPTRVLLLASIQPAAEDSTQRLAQSLADVDQRPNIDSAVSTEARAAASSGDVAALVKALAEAARTVDNVQTVDVVALAQYSLSPAASGLTEELGVPVLAAPKLAVSKLAREREVAAQ